MPPTHGSDEHQTFLFSPQNEATARPRVRAETAAPAAHGMEKICVQHPHRSGKRILISPRRCALAQRGRFTFNSTFRLPHRAPHAGMCAPQPGLLAFFGVFSPQTRSKLLTRLLLQPPRGLGGRSCLHLLAGTILAAPLPARAQARSPHLAGIEGASYGRQLKQHS